MVLITITVTERPRSKSTSPKEAINASKLQCACVSIKITDPKVFNLLHVSHVHVN